MLPAVQRLSRPMRRVVTLATFWLTGGLAAVLMNWGLPTRVELVMLFLNGLLGVVIIEWLNRQTEDHAASGTPPN